MKTEIEAKFPVPDVAAVQARLAARGGRLAVPWELETNILWDFQGRSLGRKHQLLRLRQAGGVALLTFKEPTQGEDVRLKTMAEVQTSVGDAATMACIFQKLGLVPVWRYEKFRSVWHLALPQGQAAVCLDIVPCGQFVEIEAPPEAVHGAAVALGLVWGNDTAATYRDLHQRWLRDQGLPDDTPMVFLPEQVRFWAEQLGIAWDKAYGSHTI
jgi:adenylate cyclase class 2